MLALASAASWFTCYWNYPPDTHTHIQNLYSSRYYVLLKTRCCLSLSPPVKSQNIHMELENVPQAAVNLGGE